MRVSKINMLNWKPIVKPFRRDSSETLSEIDNYIFNNYKNITELKSEYYKSTFVDQYNLYKILPNRLKTKYFKNNHRIFIYWLIQLSKYINIKELHFYFSHINDLPKDKQEELMYDLSQNYDPTCIDKRRLKSYKTRCIKQITKQISKLKDDFVDNIHKQKKPMQLTIEDGTMIIGGGTLRETKDILKYYIGDGFQIEDKIYTNYKKDPNRNVYIYVLKKSNRLPVMSLN